MYKVKRQLKQGHIKKQFISNNLKPHALNWRLSKDFLEAFFDFSWVTVISPKS